MTNDEGYAVADALMSWFISQRIKPGDAAFVMAITLACIMTSSPANETDIREGFELFVNMLRSAIAECLKVQ